ncbi:MAG: D-alanyl-D-alanine carboxypeptidase [Rhodospirillales bacterium]|nr:D-alanyl-D-alanine carboxypeptidase [Rhodospirillales bacterium]
MTRMRSTTVALLALVFMATGPRAEADYAAIVIDATNGNILYQHNSDKTMYPASLTKMMTLYMIFQALEAGNVTMDTMLPVSVHAQSMQPSELGLVAGQEISVDDSIMALMTKSANDVAATVAEGLGDGSEWRFGVMMTEKARELGMRNTTFTNASGWHDDNMVSTARDMAILSLRLQSDFPQYYHLFATTEWTYQSNGKTYGNHNKLIGVVDGVDGLKTGYTSPAGWNLAASALVDGRRIVAVVMGGETRIWRDRRMTELFTDGFVIAENLDRIVPIPGDHPTRGEGVTKFAALEGDELEPVAVASVEGSNTFEDLVAMSPDRNNDGLQVEQGSADDLLWALQVGAFSQFENAYRALDNAETYLGAIIGGSASTVVTAAESGGSTLYRARIVNLTEVQAREGCRALYQRDLPCAVVKYSSGS